MGSSRRPAVSRWRLVRGPAEPVLGDWRDRLPLVMRVTTEIGPDGLAWRRTRVHVLGFVRARDRLELVDPDVAREEIDRRDDE